MKVLVFDLDGVLLKEDGYWEVNSIVSEELIGKPMPFSFIQDSKNAGLNSNWDITHEFVKESGITFDELVALYNKRHAELGRPQEEKIPALELESVLTDLSKNFELAIVTGRRLKSTMNGINTTVLSKFFTEACAFTPDKVDPTTIETLSKVDQLNLVKNAIPADEYYYAGDAVTDIESAKTAGFIPIGVYGSLQNRQQLEEAGAEIIVESVAELPQCLHRP